MDFYTENSGMGRLHTKDRLAKWGISINQECSLCSSELETTSHLFFQCPFSANIWNNILQWQGIMTNWMARRTAVDDDQLQRENCQWSYTQNGYSWHCVSSLERKKFENFQGKKQEYRAYHQNYCSGDLLSGPVKT